MLNNKLSIIIHTCDKYSDLWEGQIKLLNENWSNRNIETFLVTDLNRNIIYDNIKILSAGQGKELSQRTSFALQFIKTEYVFITLDDYFLLRPVSSEKIERLINIMDKENIDYIRLFSDPNSFKKFKKYKKLYEISLNKNYEVNLYQGIWRKSFIEKTLKEPLNAWQYEVSLTGIARETNAKCVLSKGNEYKILDVVRKGKLLHKASKYINKHNLYHGTREIIQYKEEFRIFIYNYGKKILPHYLAKLIKKILIKRGHKFYSKID